MKQEKKAIKTSARIEGYREKLPERQKSKGDKSPELRVLILEDNPADAELMERQLLKEGIAFVSRRVDSRRGFLQALKSFRPLLILADYSLPKFDALQALELAREKQPFTPFIVVTGSIGEEKAAAVLRAGADDYLLKDRLARLAESVRHALANHQLRSEKMAAEESLRVHELLHHAFIDSSSDMAFLKDEKFRHLLANKELCRFYKKTEKEIIGKTDAELLDKSAAARCRRTDRLALTGNRVHVSQETIGDLTFETRKFPVKLSDNHIGVGGYIRDISEGERFKEALQAAAASWRTTFDSMNDAVCLLDEKGAIRQCNRAMNRLLDIPYAKIVGENCLALVCGAKKKSTCAFRLLLKDRLRHEEETYWRKRWFQVTVDPIIGADGRPLGAVHIMIDITAAKKAKEALRESEERFRGLYENANIGLYRTTPDGRILMANPALIRMLGYGSFAELAERNLQKEGFEPDYPRREFRRQVERLGSVTGLEANWHKKDGASIFVRESARVIKDAEGTIVFYDGTVEDISEGRRAEETLREMNEIFRLFLKHNPIYVFIKDENIRPIYLSENYETMLKRPLAELLGKSMNELFPSALSRSMVEDDKKILRAGKPREFIEELEGRVYSTLKFPIFIQGKAKYLAGYTTDITEHRQSQELLQATSRRLQLALQSAQAGAWDWNVTTGLIEWSPQMFTLFGLDPRTTHASFATWRTALHPEDRELAEKRIDQALKQHATLDSDYRVVLPGGQIRWINAEGEGVYDGSGRPIQMIGICLDITERKLNEQRIRDSLREKEILLKEIHHRVKNNLQVVSGLLSLQSAQTNDEQLQRLVKASQARIWTMALIHQTLYQSGNLADIDMADYIRSLVGNLLSAHAQVVMPPTILYDLEPLRLVIDKAIPLALIVNELATNAIKHAFPDGRAGDIRISLQARRDAASPARSGKTGTAAKEDLEYELIVADDGIGLPVGFDVKNQKSLGLQLVSMLTGQLEGTLVIEPGTGTSVRITFATHEQNNKNP